MRQKEREGIGGGRESERKKNSGVEKVRKKVRMRRKIYASGESGSDIRQTMNT